MAELHGGIVGCGFFAANHLHAWKEVSGAKIVAVCDLDLQRARGYAERFSITGYHDSLDSMIRANCLDFVDIVTTPETHRDLVEAAANQSVHVICQKPMAPSYEDGLAMVRACREAGVRFMVHENFRWQVPLRAVKAASAEIGPIHFARLRFHSGHDVYSSQPYLAKDERFIVYDLGVHLLDLARCFVGEIKTLHCRISRVDESIRGEDVATMLLESQSGAHVVIELSYASEPIDECFPQTSVTLEGRDGSLRLDPEYRLLLRIGDQRSERHVPPLQRPWAEPPGHLIQDSVVHAQQNWVDSLCEGVDAETSGADNLRTLDLVFGAYRSAETGQVYVPRIHD